MQPTICSTPCWLAQVIAVLAALTPVAIGALGIWIAVRQVRIAQQQAQTSSNKLKLDLFDRRVSVYEAAHEFVVDVMFAFPVLLLALAVVAILGPGTTTTILAIGIVYTPIFARVARASTLSVRVEPYVQMSRAMGTGSLYILGRHIVPNIAGPLIVQTSLSLAFAILSEAALSFLGLGIQPPQPSLGRMIFDSQGFVTMAWWMAVFPGAAIFVIVLAFNLVGDGLRDVLDPKQRTMIEARSQR